MSFGARFTENDLKKSKAKITITDEVDRSTRFRVVDFDISPRPYLRMTSGQVKLAKRPRNTITDAEALRTWDRIRSYWEYKSALVILAKQKRFTLPECNFHAIFYIPMPKSWSQAKKSEMWGTPHRQTPDRDNYIKAVQDALCKNDGHIWDGRETKVWAIKPGIKMIVDPAMEFTIIKQ